MGECFLIQGLSRRSSVNPFTYTYSGAYTESDITVNGIEYTLLTLTGSGTLTASREINADVWMCGGGGNGGDSTGGIYFEWGSSGGGGGGGYVASGSMNLNGDISVIVGAATGSSSFADLNANGGASASHVSGIGSFTPANGGSGGSGGAGGAVLEIHDNSYVVNAGTGAGISTRPYEDQMNFPNLHCAGGSSGSLSKFHKLSSTWYDENAGGAIGGSNGSNGGASISGAALNIETAGASYGGGTGGGLMSYNVNGGSATFYGSGGGGAGSSASYFGLSDSSNSEISGFGGSGYQGVIYVRFKKEDAA